MTETKAHIVNEDIYLRCAVNKTGVLNNGTKISWTSHGPCQQATVVHNLHNSIVRELSTWK